MTDGRQLVWAGDHFTELYFRSIKDYMIQPYIQRTFVVNTGRTNTTISYIISCDDLYSNVVICNIIHTSPHSVVLV